MNRAGNLLAAVVAVIHLLPLAGLAGGEALARLYGVTDLSPDLALLLQHRAVLFGLLGGLLLWSIVRPALRPAALLAAWVSVLSFLLLAWVAGSPGTAIMRVVIADLVALACLLPITLGRWRGGELRR